MKVIPLSFTPEPKKSLQRARNRKANRMEAAGQLNLFAGAKVVSMNQEVSFSQAVRLDDSGYIDAAREAYKKCIDQNLHAADAWCNLGVLDYENKDPQTALLCFTSCLKLDPAHAEAHYNLGNIYADLANLPLAEFHYQAAIKFNPRLANSYFNLAVLQIKNGHADQAIGLLQEYCRYASDYDQVTALELVRKIQDVQAS